MYHVYAYLNGFVIPTRIDTLPYKEAVELMEDIPGSYIESVTTDSEIDRACEREINRGV